MKHSAGLLLYRIRDNRPEVFLVHPGGPFWKNKDIASWSIPKGEVAEGEDPLQTAKREFAEETGFAIPDGVPIALSQIGQSGNKIVSTWYLQGDVDPAAVRSNLFQMEWPPKSGKNQQFPEVDKAAWYGLDEAKVKVHKGQIPIIEELERILEGMTN